MTETKATSAYTKDNPFWGQVTENRLLSGPGSGKETRHIVVSLADSGLRYKAGDSLGVYPSHRPQDVDAILGQVGASGEEPVALPKAAGTVAFAEALRSKLELSKPTRRILETLEAKASDPAEKASLARLLAPESKEALAAWLGERHYIDLLAEFPSARLRPQELVDHMRRLVPRLYSIASSWRAHPLEAQLTVAAVRYRTNGRDRVGVCSTHLSDRVPVWEGRVPVFVARSPFGPPADGTRDAVMVGPGTGIAPFRAFVEERAALGATGRNWLFFGDQRRASDFLYEEDWARWLADGSLTRMSTAFSRDQPQKIYVQDRMRESAADLWAWIRAGAHFYVCGDASRMAKDVDQALHEVVAGQGGMSPAEAIDYVKLMKKDKRYQRDVY